MKIFLTGATGYIGSAVAEALQAAGHAVAGLARSAEAEQTLKTRAITPLSGDLKEPKSLASSVESCDGVIHCGTTNDGHHDADAVGGMLETLKGTYKPFLYTSGVWVLGNTGDVPATEESPVDPPQIVEWRPNLETDVLAAAEYGIRTMVLRPGVVYGWGLGLPALFVQTANEKGAGYYIGDGQNRWPTVHVEDLADLYVRLIEKGVSGLYHGVEGSSVRVREIAAAASFGAGAGGKTASWTPVEAADRFGGALVEALLLDQVVSGEKAKRELGWDPKAVPLVEDLRYGSYAMARINP
jgi:nucleoside-diphosphate-sugar epimerase